MVELTNEQKNIVKQACLWFNDPDSDQIFEISGRAGTGKSIVLRAIVEALQLNESEISPCAYTGAAALVMRRKGFPTASTIHSLLYKYITYRDPLTGRKKSKFVFEGVPLMTRLIIVDEASFCDIDIKKDLMWGNRKILAAGDINQLPPINNKPAFFQNPKKIHYLTKIMRQNENSPIITASFEVLNGHELKPGNYGEVLVITRSDFFKYFVQAVNKFGIILCATNNMRDQMNDRVRHEVYNLKSVLPCKGERLINRQNIWSREVQGIPLVNGLLGQVLNNPDISEYKDGKFKINFKVDFMNQAFEDLLVDYKYFTSDYNTRRQIKDSFYSHDEPSAKMEFAYACTTHVAQGSQFPTGIYIQESFPKMTNNLHYTAVTRFSEKLLYVVPNKSYVSYASIPKGDRSLPIPKIHV